MKGTQKIPTNALLGYDTDEDGEMVIIAQEAEVVRMIYGSFCQGVHPSLIATRLNSLGQKTVYGNNWTTSAVKGILCNEKYCGDVVMQKTITTDYLTHKSKKNEGEAEKFYVADHHDAIVSREVWSKAQDLLEKMAWKKWKRRSQIRLTPLKSGWLRGFVSINASWKSVSWTRLESASKKYAPFGEETPDNNETLNDESEELILSENSALDGFEVVELSQTRSDSVMNVSTGSMRFNKATAAELNYPSYIRVLVNAANKKVAIQSCTEKTPNAIAFGSNKGRSKKIMFIVFIIVLCIGLIVLGLSLFGKKQMSKIPDLSFREALEYTTKNNADAVITVGIIKDGQASYTVYGENGKELPNKQHTYEIGSLTKTFTATLIAKAAQEGKIDIDATIDRYLDLPDGNTYPTVSELLTHTSGYNSFYFESPMISNFFKGRNDFCGVTKEMVKGKASSLNMTNANYKFKYSNFGYAVLGLVLESVYGQDYTALVNDFALNELKLSNTHISDRSGALGHYWDWNDNDAYLSAGGITSDINDILSYAQMQLDEFGYMADCHKTLKIINASTSQYKMMGINMDEIGMSWIIDKENGFIWHNGGTGNYNCYLGFNPENGTAVVVLSNLSPNYRIPATVLGVKVLEELK